MPPGDESAREILRDRVPLDETGEQALTEQLHHRFRVPVLEGVKGAVVGESPIGEEKVSVGMPEPPHMIPIVRESRFSIGFTLSSGVSSRSSRHLGLRTVVRSRSRIPLAAD